MKGPGLRLDLDVRRRWECPVCGQCLPLSGHITQAECFCRGDGPVAMKLVERCHKTESPFDHVGFAAQKRIDAVLRKPEDVTDAPAFDVSGSDPPRDTVEMPGIDEVVATGADRPVPATDPIPGCESVAGTPPIETS
jgi:hypothetical protein